MPDAPLPRDAVARATAPLPQAHAMPAGFYTSEEIFARERQQIFLKHWIFAGREDETPDPGDYRAIDTVGGPVLLIRGEDATLRAFANFCRHRGALLLQDQGTTSRIVCPYHAWSYFIDGRLYGCPDMADAEGFDRVENGLVPVRQRRPGPGHWPLSLETTRAGDWRTSSTSGLEAGWMHVGGADLGRLRGQVYSVAGVRPNPGDQ